MATAQQIMGLIAQFPDENSRQIAERADCLPEYVRATIKRQRSRGNSTTLHARVLLDLSNRMHAHLVEKRKGHGGISDFVSDAIAEKLDRETAKP